MSQSNGQLYRHAAPSRGPVATLAYEVFMYAAAAIFWVVVGLALWHR